MASIGTIVSGHVASLLRSPGGFRTQLGNVAELAGIEVAPAGPECVLEQGAPSADATVIEKYPAVYVFCEKLTNNLTEKGRRFSGKARISIECRVSQDRTDGLDAKTRVFTDAIAEVLYNARGRWPSGMFYSGAYEIQFGPIRRGGKNVVQSAKVLLDVDVSSN